MINHNAQKSSDFLKYIIRFVIYDQSYMINHVIYFGLKTMYEDSKNKPLLYL